MSLPSSSLSSLSNQATKNLQPTPNINSSISSLARPISPIPPSKDDVRENLIKEVRKLLGNSGAQKTVVINKNKIYICDAEEGPCTDERARKFTAIISENHKRLKENNDKNLSLISQGTSTLEVCAASIQEMSYRIRFFNAILKGNNSMFSTSSIASLRTEERYGAAFRLETIKRTVEARKATLAASQEELKKVTIPVSSSSSSSSSDQFLSSIREITSELVWLKEFAVSINKSLHNENKGIAASTCKDQKMQLDKIKAQIILSADERKKTESTLESQIGVEQTKKNSESLPALVMKKEEVASRFKKFNQRVAEIEKLFDERKQIFKLTDEDIKAAGKVDDVTHSVDVNILEFFKRVLAIKENILLENDWDETTKGIDQSESKELYSIIRQERVSRLAIRISQYEDLVKAKITAEKACREAVKQLDRDIDKERSYRNELRISLETISENLEEIKAQTKIRITQWDLTVPKEEIQPEENEKKGGSNSSSSPSSSPGLLSSLTSSIRIGLFGSAPLTGDAAL